MGGTTNSPLTDGHVPGDAGGDGGERASKIREDIEHTRSDISDTIHALQDKLNPTTLKEQAKETFQQAKDYAAHEVSEGLALAKEKVTHELHEATHAVREATIGRVEHMVERAGKSVNEASTTLLDVVRNNPIPVALITLGTAWLWFGRKSGGQRNEQVGYYIDEYGQRHYYDVSGRRLASNYPERGQGGRDFGQVGRQATGAARRFAGDVSDTASHVGTQVAGTASNLAGKVTSAASSVGHNVADAASSVGHQVADTAGHVAGRIGDAASSVGSGAAHLAGRAGDGIGYLAHEARDGVGHLAEGARYGVVRAEQGLARAFNDNPLAIGAAVLAVGTVVGLALPATHREDELMGDLRDRLRDGIAERAQDLALNAIDAAESRATETARAFGNAHA